MTRPLPCLGLRWRFSLAVWAGCGAAHGAAAADDAGRDFPKTLIFDEPGIDDEVSLPTVLFLPRNGGRSAETDVDFELDKRLTTRTSVQINAGYTALPLAERTAYGWQNVDVTLKHVVFAAPEQLVSLSLIREFGQSGAARVEAPAPGSTSLGVNFGQGLCLPGVPWVLQPLAITGTVGGLVPDRDREAAFPQAIVSASLQYSLKVLARGPGWVRPLLPIVEFSDAVPVGHEGAARATLAPGLIYAGRGFQLAAEALVPLTRASGTQIGFIAQINISLSVFGEGAWTRPVW